MFKKSRRRLRKITFFLQLIFQRKKIVSDPRAINVARVCKLEKIDLAQNIIYEKSKPLRVYLKTHKSGIDLDVVEWRVLNKNETEFKVNINGTEDALEQTFKRIFDLLPLIKTFHSSKFYKKGWVIINLGDYAKVDGLALCSNRKNQILIPDVDFMSSNGYKEIRDHFQKNQISWNQKIPVVFWRGSTTGISPTGSWRDLQRIRLCEIASNVSNQNFFDVGVSSIVQLNKGDEIEIKKLGYFKQFMPVSCINTYKYLIDIDGNSNAWSGLFQKLLSGSVVLKVESEDRFRQWYYDRLIPWEHYIPIKKDLSDLMEKVEWLKSNDRAAEQIAINGYALVESLTYHDEVSKATELISQSLT
jgi:hypothetical protein